MPDAVSAFHNVPTNSLEVRERLVEALNLDLIGPRAGHDLASERLPGWVRPSNWYLTGFLIPAGAPPMQSADADEDGDLDEMPHSAGLAEESTDERKAAKKAFFPSSMGLSFLVPGDSDTVSVTVRWADYALAPIENAEGKPATVWQREQREQTERVSLTRADDYPVACSGGLSLHVEVRPIDTAGIAGIPTGTRSVSVFLVNRRKPDEDNPDLAYAFQAEIEVQGERAFVPRPDLRGAQAEDWDDQVADLHYADTPEFATGHGVSADWEILNGACRRLRTAWIPSASVEKTDTVELSTVELSMESLGALADATAVGSALRPLVAEYRAWIEGRRDAMGALQGARRETAEGLLLRAAHAADRIEHGIALLAEDEDALDAFRERVDQQPFADEAERDERMRSVQNRVVDLLDSWHTVVDDYHQAGVTVQYQRYELRSPSPLLREMLDKDFETEHHRKFRANRSLRDVEPVVDLFLRDLTGRQVEGGA